MELNEALSKLKESGALVEGQSSGNSSWFEIAKDTDEADVDEFVETVYNQVEPDVVSTWSNTTDQVYIEFNDKLKPEEVATVLGIADEMGIEITDLKVNA